MAFNFNCYIPTLDEINKNNLTLFDLFQPFGCIFPGCNNDIKDNGYCSIHKGKNYCKEINCYNEVNDHNNYCINHNTQLCNVNHCDNILQTTYLCENHNKLQQKKKYKIHKHYSQLKPKNKKCIYKDCINEQFNNNLCIKHKRFTQWEKKAKCKIEGCMNIRKKKQLCIRHTNMN